MKEKARYSEPTTELVANVGDTVRNWYSNSFTSAYPSIYIYILLP